MKKKILALTLVFALALALGIGGTVAWLTAKTDSVVNTFTVGDINITLAETSSNQDTDNDPNTNSYKMVPGATITKDPKVTVLKNSEACWLFVKVEKSTNFDIFMEYEMADGWTLVDGQTDVYYRTVAATSTADTTFSVIKNDSITVKSSVTKEMLTASTFTSPSLKITAYAIQSDNLKNADSTNATTAAEAWALISH